MGVVTKRSQISKIIEISKALIIYIAYTLISKSTEKWPNIPYAGLCVEIQMFVLSK